MYSQTCIQWSSLGQSKSETTAYLRVVDPDFQFWSAMITVV